MLRTLFQMLGDHYGRTDLRDVEVIVRSILAAVPGDATALHFLGLVYYRTDRRSAAVSAFARAAPVALLTIPPDAGEQFLARNGYSAAAACQIEAIRPSSGLAYAWYDVGVSLAELGYPYRAVSAFHSSLASWPQFPAAGRAIAALSSHIERHGAHEGEPLHLAALDPIGGGGSGRPCPAGRTIALNAFGRREWESEAAAMQSGVRWIWMQRAPTKPAR